MNDTLNIQGIAELLFNLFRWICIFAFILSIVGLTMTVKKDLPLIMDSTITNGTIIGFEKRSLNRQGKLTIANMFPYQVAVVSFRDGSGKSRKVISKYGNNASQIGMPVKVIYSNRNPENAIVDEGMFHNWLSEYVWLFIVVASFLGIKRFSKKPEFVKLKT